jgi:hypothetical protein
LFYGFIAFEDKIVCTYMLFGAKMVLCALAGLSSSHGSAAQLPAPAQKNSFLLLKKIDSSHESGKNLVTWALPASTTIIYNDPVLLTVLHLTKVFRKKNM